MPDYYIRTPDNESSRGPFDIPKLLTLAEAGQVTENTLFYDETKEEWIPIALSETLKDQVFPTRERLKLKLGEEEDGSKPGIQDDEKLKEGAGANIRVESMLAAAEGETDETKHLKERSKSFDKAASLATNGIGIMLLLSAVSLLLPHYDLVKAFIDEETYSQVLNYPFFIVGLLDLLLGIFLFLAITETFPFLRGRAMITLGFGVYVGWALGDPILMAASALAGLGIFWATIAQSYYTMLTALALGIIGNGYMAYLAFDGRFKNFFELARMSIIEAK